MELDEAKRLMSGPFGKQLLVSVRGYVIPFYWGSPKEGDVWSVDNNGTAFAIQFDGEPFLLTASHVYEGYLKRKGEARAIRCQLGNFGIDPEKRLIDYRPSNELDIATFKISRKELSALGKYPVVESSSSWPPPNATADRGVIFGGFPGIERKAINEAAYSFGTHLAVTPITSSSARHFGCAFEREEWIDITGNGIPPERYDLGGISGGPAFTFEESGAGVVSWRLGGVVYNASRELGEILLVHHASFIKPSGHLCDPA